MSDTGSAGDINWPHLPDACPEWSPATGRACIVGTHRGYHQDASGHQWPAGSIWEQHDDPELNR